MFDTIKNALKEVLSLVTKIEELENRVSDLESKSNGATATNATTDETQPANTDGKLPLEFETIDNAKEEDKKTVHIGYKKRWPRHLHEIAVRMFNDGCTDDEISVEVGIPVEKVHSHLYKTVRYRKPNKTKVLGFGEGKRWNIIETNLAFEMNKNGRSTKEIAEKLNRSEHAVVSKLSKINCGIDGQLNPDGTEKKRK